MPEAQGALSYVYQGVWTNWSKGKANGATLTLSPRNAAVLIAFLALFVQMSGAQLWGIIKYALHQARASNQPEDGLYHQQQAVLRNSGADISAFWQLVRICWAWRRRARRPWLRSLPLIILTLFHFALFVLAGIMSSKLAEAGQEVLTRSPFCGFFNDSFLNSFKAETVPQDFLEFSVEYLSKGKRDALLSQQYVESCYNRTTTPRSACDVFRKKQLSWQSAVTDTCPFNSSVCLNPPQSVTLDTGFLESQNDFGLNAEKRDRVSYRRIATCTPLNHEGYVSRGMNVSSNDGSSTTQVVHAYYGPARVNPFNATLTYRRPSGSARSHEADADPYTLHLNYAYAGSGSGDAGAFRRTFDPIPQLELTDSDLFLVHLTTENRYTHPVDDPWFWAHREDILSHEVEGANFTATTYGRDRPITTLGCALQHQICAGSASTTFNSSGPCTPLMGINQLRNDSRGIDALNMTSRQGVTSRRVLSTAEDADLSYLLEQFSKGSPPLLAASKFLGLLGEPLPSDQWQIETNYWQALSMAHMQWIFLEHATGQIATDTSHLQPARTPEERWICANQIIRGTAYESFSVLALALIFAFGILIVVLSLFAVDLVSLLQRRRKRGAVRREMWIATEALQLLRMVFEKAGQGTWHGTSDDVVPVTESGEKLELLAVDAGEERTAVGAEGPPVDDNQSHRPGSGPDEQADPEGQISRVTGK